MSKKYKHWNDGKYTGLKDHFKTGKLADDINRDFVNFILNDFDNSNLKDAEKKYVGDRLEKMVSLMEDIGATLRDANAIGKLYGVDYEQRRIRWEKARGYCFRMMDYLDNMVVFIPNIKNKQKYADTSARLLELAGKIYNLIVSDDKHKTKHCKKYMGND